MSVLFLATDADALVAQLAQEVRKRQTPDHYLIPQTVVVPNRFVERWVKLRLARELDVAINLRFRFLESALWDWLREIDPRRHAAPPEMLDDESYRLLVLSVLLLEDDAPLKPLQDFCERPGNCAGPEALERLSRLASRRAWDLAQRLASLIRDYEYHRQEQIIQPWLRGEPALDGGGQEREAAQRCVFNHITREADGKRALLNQRTGRNFKTLPQYVMELLEDVGPYREPPRHTVHLYGLTQLSPLHLRALELLVPFLDCKVYHLNPMAGRVGGRADRAALQTLAASFRGNERPDAHPGTDLLHVWGRAGAESFGLTADLLKSSGFRVRTLAPRKPRRTLPTVLGRLQDHLLGRADEAAERLAQDCSLQVIGCPGIWREAETVHNSIVHHLQQDPALRQNDIGILVTDMDLYRPYLTAVFERAPRPVAYGMADFTAARLSVFGQALVGMLDLALETFARSRVLEVLLNPCFLARLGLDPGSAAHWVEWAEQLGIHHGLDADEKKEKGLYPSALYSWKLGVQRLRLGRYMEVADDDRPPPRWRQVIPFADVDSADREKLDAFCRAVEGLLPALHRLRHFRGTAQAWAERLRTLIGRFLQVPADRTEEEPVRDAILTALDRFRHWDVLHDHADLAVPLALVREYVAGQLRNIPGRHNDVLAGGVTIAALQPQRPLPFSVLYVMGMGDLHFPGSSFLSPLDLRYSRRQAGDILPVEQMRFAFLEAVLSARKKLYLTYNQRDLQKDQELQPAVPLLQLRRFLEKHVTAEATFRFAQVPLLGHSEKYLEATDPDGPHDVFVQYRPHERLLALESALRKDLLRLDDLNGRFEIEEQRRLLARVFDAPATPPADPARVPTVPLARLKDFLANPAEAALRWHLGLRGWVNDDPADHEPLVAPQFMAKRITHALLQDLIRRAETEPVEKLAKTWQDDFRRRYEDGMLCSRLPEHAFAETDQAALLEELKERLDGDRGLLAFLAGQAGKTPVGPVLLGTTLTPLHVRLRLPSLEVELARALTTVPCGRANVVGSMPFAWHSPDGFDLLIASAVAKDGSELRKGVLDRESFEPLLFVLSMIAAEVPCVADATEIRLHFARPDGVQSVRLATGLDRPGVRQYLARLVTDCLDPACADLLPFASVRDAYALRDALHGRSFVDRPGFAEELQRQVERDAAFTNKSLVNLTDAGFRVSADACHKLWRRFAALNRLLDADSDRPAPRARAVAEAPA